MEADAGSLAGSNVPAGNKIEILYIYIYIYIYICILCIYIYTLGVEIKLAFFGGIFFVACFFLSSRLPSLVLAAKISHLLHFVAKISHSYCSSICPLVSGFVSWFLSRFPLFSLVCP